MKSEVLDEVCIQKLYHNTNHVGREGRFHPDNALRDILKNTGNDGYIPDRQTLPEQGLEVLGPGRQNT